MPRLTVLLATARRFIRDAGGGAAIEYSIVAVGVAVAVAATVTALGTDVKTNLYDKLAGLF